MTSNAFFVTGTGTMVGKTWVTRGLARAWRDEGRNVVAIKPFETGCTRHGSEWIGEDAQALDHAAGVSSQHASLYRVEPPLAPWAATRRGCPPPNLDAITSHVEEQRLQHEAMLVEGAGGIMVPLTAEVTIADFAEQLGLPIVLVARDGLGVLSYVATALVTAREHRLTVAAIALTQHGEEDPSREQNADLLRALHAPPVFVVQPSKDDDRELAHKVEALAHELIP